MYMNKQHITIVVLLSIVAFGAGFFLGGLGPTVGSHAVPDGSTMKDREISMGSAMRDMLGGLTGKKGEAFDQAFLDEMIVHHEGAVNMAAMALESAQHDELKEMARNIVSAQTAEIAQMKQWLRDWYGE
jgi:uncharacterized protein (DUF305 family)